MQEQRNAQPCCVRDERGRASSKAHSMARRVVASLGATVLTATLACVGGQPAQGYEKLVTTDIKQSASQYGNYPDSTATARFAYGLTATVGVATTNPAGFTGAVVSSKQPKTYMDRVFDTNESASDDWPLMYFPLVPKTPIDGGDTAASFVRTLESNFGLSSSGFSTMKDVGAFKLTFSRPLVNPIIRIAGPGMWIRCLTGGCGAAGGAIVSFNPQYTFTATNMAGQTVTPTLYAPQVSAGTGYYYAVKGNSYGPIYGNVLQPSAAADMAGVVVGGHGQSYTLAPYMSNVASSLVTYIQVNTNDQPVTQVKVQTSYQMISFGVNAGKPASNDVATFNLQYARDPFYTVMSMRNSEEVSGYGTPSGYGLAVHSMSENSPNDLGYTKTTHGLAIGASVVPYNTGTEHTSATPAAPTNSNNSNAGYDGVTPAQLTALSGQAIKANQGKQISLTVPLSNVEQPAVLSGYLDFQGAEKFTGTNNRASVNVAAGATSATLTWTVPNDVPTAQKTSWLRLRLQYGTWAGSLTSYTNNTTTPKNIRHDMYADSGEVEDYKITVGGTAPAQTFTVSKTVDTSVAKPKDLVTYTVLATNTGAQAVDATFTDDLTGVLDSSTLVEPLPTTMSRNGNILSWKDRLQPGESRAVSYSVRVNDTLPSGATLKNVVTPDSNGTCDAAVGCTTNTPTNNAGIKASKWVCANGTGCTVPAQGSADLKALAAGTPAAGWAKETNLKEGADVQWLIMGTNTGDTALPMVLIAAESLVGSQGNFSGCDPSSFRSFQVAPGATVTCVATYTLNSGDADTDGTVTNTVLMGALTSANESVTDESSASVAINITPIIHLPLAGGVGIEPIHIAGLTLLVAASLLILMACRRHHTTRTPEL